jgi:hypothetical protein
MQELVAPEVRVLRAEVRAVGQRVDDLRTEINQRFELMEKVAAVRHEALLAAIADSRSASEAVSMREIAALRERVAVLESRR